MTFKNFLKESSQTFAGLPQDIQTVIEQFFEIHGQYDIIDKLKSISFEVENINLDEFPNETEQDFVADDGTNDRDANYASAIPYDKFPILVNGRTWLDGRHRVWAAKKQGKTTIKAIDLGKYGLNPNVQALGFLRSGMIHESLDNKWSWTWHPHHGIRVEAGYHQHENIEANNPEMNEDPNDPSRGWDPPSGFAKINRGKHEIEFYDYTTGKVHHEAGDAFKRIMKLGNYRIMPALHKTLTDRKDEDWI